MIEARSASEMTFILAKKFGWSTAKPSEMGGNQPSSRSEPTTSDVIAKDSLKNSLLEVQRKARRRWETSRSVRTVPSPPPTLDRSMARDPPGPIVAIRDSR